jgi:hypothetical protein
MKSLNFTVPGLIPLIRSGVKRTTIRMLFVPDFYPGEHVILDFKIGDVKIPVAEVEIGKIYPIQMKDITLEVAITDGFKSIEDCKTGLQLINKIPSNRFDEHWGFVIPWNLIVVFDERETDSIIDDNKSKLNNKVKNTFGSVI